MSVIAILQLISTLAGSIDEIVDIITKIHALNLQPGDAVPQEHVDAVNAALTKVKTSWQPPGFSWEDNHAGE
jgi:hypothetical protein